VMLCDETTLIRETLKSPGCGKFKVMVCDPVPVTSTVKLSSGRTGAPAGGVGALAGITSVTRSLYVPVAGTSTVTVCVIGAPRPLGSCPRPSRSPGPPNAGGVGVAVGVGVATTDLLVLLGDGLPGFLSAKAGDASKSAEAVITEVVITTALFFRFMGSSFVC